MYKLFVRKTKVDVSDVKTPIRHPPPTPFLSNHSSPSSPPPLSYPRSNPLGTKPSYNNIRNMLGRSRGKMVINLNIVV